MQDASIASAASRPESPLGSSVPQSVSGSTSAYTQTSRHLHPNGHPQDSHSIRTNIKTPDQPQESNRLRKPPPSDGGHLHTTTRPWNGNPLRADPENLIYRAPENGRPGEYRYAGFTDKMATKADLGQITAGPSVVKDSNMNQIPATAEMDAEQPVSELPSFKTDVELRFGEAAEIPVVFAHIMSQGSESPPKLRRVRSMPVRSHEGPVEDNADLPEVDQDDLSYPSSPISSTGMPMSTWDKSSPCLSPLKQPKQVTFPPYVKSDGATHFGPESDHLSQAELKAMDARIKAHDRFYQLLHLTCLQNPWRFVSHAPSSRSDRRQKLSSTESHRFWNQLIDKSINLASEPIREIQLHVMEKMFELIWHDAFQHLPTEHEMLSWERDNENAETLANKLADFFAIFERDTAEDDHKRFLRDLKDLVLSAYSLRALLKETSKFTFCVNIPGKGACSSQVQHLRNTVSILETHGASHKDDSNDFLYFKLCGGIGRTHVKEVWPSRGQTIKFKTVAIECRAIGVAWRPAEGEDLSQCGHRGCEDPMANPRLLVQQLARYGDDGELPERERPAVYTYAVRGRCNVY